MAISTKRLPIVNPVNRIKYPNCYDGYQYALDIVAGKINASIYTIGACKRFLKEVGQENQKWKFDYDKAERYLRIAQQFKHVKGKWKSPHIIFEPWQKWVWMNIEGFRIKDTDFRRFRFAHIDVARGNTKPLALDTIVPTPDGLKEWRDIGVGSKLYDRSGNICAVVRKNKTFLNPESQKMIFSDGTEIITGLDHEWYTSTREEISSNDRKEKIRTTSEIRNSLAIGEESNHAIYATSPIVGKHISLPINPHIMGHAIASDSRLRIPEIFQRSDVSSREQLLRGILSLNVGEEIPNGASVVVSRKGLCRDIEYLASSLGYIVHVSRFKERYELKYRISIGREDKRYIVDVVDCEPTEMFCVEVDSPDHTFLVTERCIATHNSTMASIAVLFNLSLDSPLGNRVSTVATTKDQARLVFDDARAMAEGNKAFLRKTKCEVQKHKIIHEDSNSEARPLSAEASNLDGLNDVLAVCDELHAMKREVFEVITSGMSKRFDSLVLSITTAGDDDSSVGFAENQYAKAICLGHVKDDSRFAVVYTLDKDDNIYDPEVWIKANPNWGVSVDPETFKSKIYKTLEEPRDLPNVKIKHLNIWTSEEHSYFDVNKWDKCADPDLTFDKVKHLPCMAAIDLAQYKDLSSRGYVFYDKEADLYYVLEKTYVPSKVLNTKIASDFYNGWVEEGYLNTHEGEVMNFAQFGDELEEECKDLVIGKVAYDKWSAVELAQRKSDVLDMVEFAQSKQNFSEPTKKFDALIKSKQIRHNGSPLLRWCLSNVVVDEDSNSNVKPRKPTNDEKKKVDPIIAIIMALALWINDDTVGSVYEERGLLTI